MAVVIKNSMNGLGAIKKIGIPQMLYDWLHASEVMVKLTASQFQFSFTLDGKPEMATVDVSLDQLQKLNAGTLPALEKNQLSTALAKAISGIMTKANGGGVVSKPPEGLLNQLPPLLKSVSAATAKASPQQESAIKSTQKAEGLWAMYDLTKIKTDPVVDLRDATKMYQPVKGTSGGSRYFVVAGNDDLRVAARYKNDTLSVRIEGPKWEKHIASIKACGFDLKDQKKNYCSVHLAVPEQVLAQKTLGAVLLGLGIPLDTPIPNLNVIKA